MQEVNTFKELIRKSNYPCKGCCGKRHSCCCCFKEIFGSLSQQRFLLERNYLGHHYKIKSENTNSSTKIDAMFFPAVDCEDPL